MPIPRPKPRRRPAPATTLALALAYALAVAMPAASAFAAPPKLDPREVPAAAGEFVPGEVIVRFERGTRAVERRATREAVDVELHEPIGLRRAQVVATEGGVLAAVRRLERQPDVAYAQPNYRYRARAVSPPLDTFFGELWGLSDFAAPDPGVDALAAWEATRGDGQIIAVADTGVALDHPDLESNLWTNPGETEDGSDGDGNGRVDDVHGYDFVDGDSDPDDYGFHGTHVAGTAAAIADNGAGVAGVAPQAEIMAVRVLDGDGSGSTATVADGIRYAAEEGADVVNLSLSGPAGGPGDDLMSDAIAAAAHAGAVVVAAAGNSMSDNDDPAEASAPCALPNANLICVAAIDGAGELAWFSSYGATTVDVGAPGTAILSAKPDYGDPTFEDDFDGGLGAWAPVTAAGSIPWGASATDTTGGDSAADSPLVDQDYAPNSDTQLVKASALDLTGERGCRMHFDARYEIEDAVDSNGNLFDLLFAGAVDSGGTDDGAVFAGDTGAAFERTEVSISDLSGQPDVFPVFALFSDGVVQLDGAHVDNLRVVCRDETYSDTITDSAHYVDPGAGSYAAFDGTSMATPHVAGVVALAQAAAIDAGTDDGPQAIVDAVRGGVNPVQGLGGITVTGGMVDACLAVGLARGTPSDCETEPAGPAPSEPGADPGPGGGTDPGPGSDLDAGAGTLVGGSAPPARDPSRRPILRRFRRSARVTRTGGFRYVFRATPRVRGRIVMRTRGRVRVSRGWPVRRRRLRIAARRFVTRRRTRVVLRFRLSHRERRILRLNRRLVLRVAVRVRDRHGQTARASRRLVLRAPRR